MIKQIFDVLSNNGFNVFLPSQHKGECIEPYVVVKLDGSVKDVSVSSERLIYTFMVYVPFNHYSILETMIFEIKKVLKTLYPAIMYAGNESTSYYDEEVNAHMVSFQYQGIRKIENF